MDDRVRDSFGSSDVQTLQRQPITGTPVEVPVPKKVIVISDFNLRPLWHS